MPEPQPCRLADRANQAVQGKLALARLASLGIAVRATQVAGKCDMKIEVIEPLGWRVQAFLIRPQGRLGALGVVCQSQPVQFASGVGWRASRSQRDSRQDASGMRGGFLGMGAGPHDGEQPAAPQQPLSRIDTANDLLQVFFGERLLYRPIRDVTKHPLVRRAIRVAETGWFPKIRQAPAVRGQNVVGTSPSTNVQMLAAFAFLGNAFLARLENPPNCRTSPPSGCASCIPWPARWPN